MDWTCGKNVRPRVRWLGYVEEDLREMKFKCTVQPHIQRLTAARSGWYSTHTYSFPGGAEIGLKTAPPVAITSLSKMQRRLLSAENSYFK